MVPRIVRSVALFLCLFIALSAGLAGAQTDPAQTDPTGKVSHPYAPGEYGVIRGVSLTKPANADPADAGPRSQSVDPRDKNAVIMSQGFEGNWPAPGWTRVDESAGGGEFLLGKRNCDPRTGSFAGWMVGGGAAGNNLACGADYPPNLETWAEYGPFDLSDATSAVLIFYIKGESEWNGLDTCWDYLFVGASTNAADYDGDAYCGPLIGGPDGNGYWGTFLDLSDVGQASLNFLGQSQVYIAFAMLSDSTVQFHGFTVDDIFLDVVSSCATPAAPALTAPANGASTADTTPTFTWNNVANGTEYAIQVDNNSDFTSPVVNVTDFATTFTPGAALAAGTYHWHVGAYNTAGGCVVFGPWSTTRTFTITSAPTCFQLTLDRTGQGGNPTASPGSSSGCSAGKYTAGQSINLSASAAAGWHVASWQGTNSNGSTSSNNTATMPAGNHTVRVNYAQNTSGAARAFLPSVQWGATHFLSPFEVEPNNNLDQANGPILLNRNYQGFPNDEFDYYFFNLPAGGNIGVVLTNITGKDPQLHLRNEANQLVVADTLGPTFSITYNAPPGVYYVRIVVQKDNNQTTPYTMRVNQPPVH